jgi:hypothetical protein
VENRTVIVEREIVTVYSNPFYVGAGAVIIESGPFFPSADHYCESACADSRVSAFATGAASSSACWLPSSASKSQYGAAS